MKDREARALLSMLGEKYELDPASISVLVELAQALPIKRQLDLVFTAVNDARDPIVKLNCRNFIRLLLEASPDLRPYLRNSIKRKGRCRAGARALVLDILELKPPSVATPPRRTPIRVSIPVGELLLTPATTSFSAIPSLYDTLAAFAGTEPPPSTRVRDFVYASGLAITATWLNTKKGHIVVSADDGYTRHYLERIGFMAALDGRQRAALDDATDWSVRLTRLDRDARAHEITEAILEILDTFVAPTPEDRGSFGILLGELIENVGRHANITTPAFVVAQVYPKKFKLGITIADAGIGIRQSFLQGDVEEYKDATKPDDFFISLALQQLVTSKRRPTQVMGSISSQS